MRAGATIDRGWAAARAVMAEQCTGRSPGGVVVAAAPLAAAVGAECLRAGGNVFDAVTTAALAETVLLPPKCGFGGDLVALVARAGEDAPVALVAVGGAPRRLADAARAGAMQVVGPTSVGVPAAAAGYAALSALGRFDRARHARAAVSLATEGFAWARVCTQLAEMAEDLVREHNPGGTRYFPGGVPIEPGAVTRLPGLAAVLREWVARGADLLSGPVGAAVVEAVQASGGVLEREDISFATARWEACAHGEVAGHDVWVTPAPTHGPTLLDALGHLGELASLGAAGAYRAAIGAIRRHQQRSGQPLLDGGTSIVSGADAEGNLAVVIHSNSFPRFGSGLVVEEFDLILGNRAGRGFSRLDGSPNFPEAGRRPATTLHAWALSRRQEATLAVGGTPGGFNQVPWNTQLVADLLRSAVWPGEAVVAPRWELSLDGDRVRVEDGFDPSDVEALRHATRGLDEAPLWGLRCAQQVVVRADAGPLLGAADPRTVGAVVPG